MQLTKLVCPVDLYDLQSSLRLHSDEYAKMARASIISLSGLYRGLFVFPLSLWLGHVSATLLLSSETSWLEKSDSESSAFSEIIAPNLYGFLANPNLCREARRNRVEILESRIQSVKETILNAANHFWNDTGNESELQAAHELQTINPDFLEHRCVAWQAFAEMDRSLSDGARKDVFDFMTAVLRIFRTELGNPTAGIMTSVERRHVVTRIDDLVSHIDDFVPSEPIRTDVPTTHTTWAATRNAPVQVSRGGTFFTHYRNRLNHPAKRILAGGAQDYGGRSNVEDHIRLLAAYDAFSTEKLKPLISGMRSLSDRDDVARHFPGMLLLVYWLEWLDARFVEPSRRTLRAIYEDQILPSIIQTKGGNHGKDLVRRKDLVRNVERAPTNLHRPTIREHSVQSSNYSSFPCMSTDAARQLEALSRVVAPIAYLGACLGYGDH